MSRYIPHEPFPKQRAFLLADNEEVLYGGSAGGGKAQLISAGQSTPTGFRRCGDLSIGDIVTDPRTGGGTPIVDINDFEHQRIWKVYFEDGEYTEINEKHLWNINRSGTTSKSQKHPLFRRDDWLHGYQVAPTWKVMEYVEKADKQRANGQRPSNVNIPIARPTQFTITSRNGEATWPIDPYFLGLMLGDGHATPNGVGFCSNDEELQQAALAWIMEHGNRYSRQNKNDTFSNLQFSGETKQYIAQHYTALGIFGHRSWEKQIPRVYLMSPLSVRFSLMQGLIDTDGYVDDRGHISYTTVSEQLAKDVQFLARSLGALAKIIIKTPTYTYLEKKLEGRLAYIVWITPHQPELFARLERKKERCTKRQNQPMRRIVGVEPTTEYADMRCITVGSLDGLYITGEDFTVTHNSDALLMGALQYADTPHFSALLLRRTFPMLKMSGALIARSHEWLQGTDAKWSVQDKNWTFPSGAILQFGYLEHTIDMYNYQGTDWNYIGFDELTQFEREQYLYLFSRLRKSAGSGLPSRMRAASNPGGVGHSVPFGDVLTPTGWKAIQDIEVGDIVFSVGRDSGLFETKVEQAHVYMNTEPLVNIEARGLSITCTPGHKIGRYLGDDLVLQTLSDMPGQVTIARSVIWDGQSISDFIVPEYNGKKKHAQPTRLKADDFMELLGWFLSEGHFVDRDRAFGISQQNPHGREKIIALLERCGFIYSTSRTGFLMYAPDWWQYFRQFGKAPQKYVPHWVKNADREQLGHLFVSLVDGDGHWVRYGQSGQYYTSSRQLADDVAEIALKLGYIVYQGQRQRGDRETVSYEVAFKEAESGGTEILTGNHIYNVETTTKRRTAIRQIEYTGPVYDIGIPESHSFVIRQNKSVWVSGNSWVRSRFITREDDEDAEDVIFIPAGLKDNPHLDQEDYTRHLMKLDPITRAQLLEGNWDAAIEGKMFKREWFHIIEQSLVPRGLKKVRYWDLAATEVKKGRQPDWTVGMLMGRSNDGIYYILDIVRDQLEPGGVETLIAQVAAQDGIEIPIRMEQEPGSAGKIVIDNFKRYLLAGYDFDGKPSTGNKTVRAKPISGLVQAGHVYIARGNYIKAFFEEVELFPDDAPFDDQVDAMSGGQIYLAKTGRRRLRLRN